MHTGAKNPFRAVLATRGRRTGREHSVMLLAVYHGGRYYFSRHRPDSDWYKNAAQTRRVKITVGGQTVSGWASKVMDDELSRKISELKYPGQQKAADPRVAIEVTVCNGQQ